MRSSTALSRPVLSVLIIFGMERSAVDAIREELALLRASLLEDELAFDPADEIDAWVRQLQPVRDPR
jgi:hypothetical protein